MINRALRRTLVYVSGFAAALMVIALIITSVVRGISADTPSAFTETQSGTSYLLRSSNGHIAVYNNRTDVSPVIETTIDAEGLRAVDRRMLEEGIEAHSYEDVLKLLEDFGS